MSIRPYEWRFVLGDLDGRPLANYSALAKDVSLGFRFLRPDAMSFRVPSDHEDVATMQSDDEPMLAAGCRTMRGYRYEPDGWRIRFAGIVWNVQDVGDTDSAWTTASVFSPFHRLALRQTPADAADRSKEGGLILRDLIDETNALGFSGIATTGYGNVYETTPTRTARFERAPIGDAAIELAKAYDGFDFAFDPVHQDSGSEDGTLAALSVYARRGTDRPDAVFAWGMAPHNVAKIERLEDPSTLANSVRGIGGIALGAPEGTATIESVVSTPASVTKYGLYQAVEALPDVVTQSFLDALMQEEAALRAEPKELVKVTPIVDDETKEVPRAFVDFDLGDTIQVWAGPALRGGFRGLQRCYGFGLAIDDQGVEKLDQIIASTEG